MIKWILSVSWFALVVALAQNQAAPDSDPTATTKTDATVDVQSKKELWKLAVGGVCLYRDPWFQGVVLCVSAGDTELHTNVSYRSLRFFGRARTAYVYDARNLRGPRRVYRGDWSLPENGTNDRRPWHEWTPGDFKESTRSARAVRVRAP